MTEIKTRMRSWLEHLLKGGKCCQRRALSAIPRFLNIKERLSASYARKSRPQPHKTQKILLTCVLPPGSEGTNLHRGPVPPGGLEDEFAQTLRLLLIQAREEKDSTRILALMDAVKKGAEAYSLLLYGYGRRDNS